MSSEQTYKQLHQIKCGQFPAVSRASSVDSSVHGYIASASEGVLLLYNVPKYIEATRSCNLRRDKCLPSHPADVQILVTEPLSWVSFNSEGLVLGVLTSSSVRGTFISFVPLTEALKCGSVELKSVGRSVRVCGGEQVTADGRAGWELRDFAWSPVAPTVFAIVLQSGSVRLYDVPPVSPSPYTLIAHLQPTVDAHCLCWSPKGKQLAVCINGHINTANGIVKGPMILQTDPQLHLKRVIQLADVFSGTPTTPLDLLWTSPYCFVLGFHSASSSGRSKGTMGAILLHAPAKSEEVHHLEIPELRNRPDSDHFQYYLRAMGSGHFVGTHSAGGEEITIFRLPPSSALTAPIALASVELPPDGSPLGMCLGFYRPDCNSDDLTAYLVTRLTSGTISPYLLDPSELLASLHLTLPSRIDLPIPAPVDVMKSVSVTSQTGSAVPSNQPVSHSMAQMRSSIQQLQEEVAHTAYQKREMAFGSTGQTASPSPSHISSAVVTSELAMKPSSPATLTKSATAAVPSLGSASQGEAAPAGDAEQNKATTVAASGDSTTLSDAKPIDELSMVVHLPESVHTAATQFSAALQTEFDAGREAWSALFQILREGPHRGDTGGGDTRAQGVDVIEARLHDSEAFLRALDTVTGELKTTAKERRDDLSASVAYAEKVRWALRLYANGDSTEIMTENLDPEAERLLNQLKRRSRLVESGLYDLETQLEALSADIDESCSHCPAGKRVIRNKSKPDSNLVQTFNVASQLIRCEHSRIDYIMECLKRLGLSDLTQESSPLQSPKDASLRNTQSWSVSKLSNSQNLEFTPAWNSLLQRDRALFRLFSKHKLPTVHAPSICPTVTTESKKPDLFAVNSKDLAASGDSASVRTPTTVKNSLNHPQQMNLDKLLNLSGEAALTNSPPAKSTLFPVASSIRSSTPASIAPLYGHTKAEIPKPMTVTPKSDTLPIPQSTAHQPFCISSGLSTSSSGLPHTPKPAASLIATPSTTPIGSQSPNLSPSLGTFVLGQKLAHTLPTSPVILAQQRTPGSPSVASNQPSSTPQGTVAQSPSTTPLSAFPKPSAPAQLPQDENAPTLAPTPSAKGESSKSVSSSAGFELSKLQSLLLEPQSLVTPSSTSPFTIASPASSLPAPTLTATNPPPPISTTSTPATLAAPFSFFSAPISGSGKLFGSSGTLSTTTESAALNPPVSSSATTVTASSTTGSTPLVTTCGSNSAITSSSPPMQKKDVSSFGVSGAPMVSPSSNVATSAAPVVGLFSGSGQPSRTSTDSTSVSTTTGKSLFGGITLGGPFGNSGFKLQPAASAPSTTQVGGLFATTTTVPSTSGYASGGLFASATSTSFSAPATTASGGLFGSFTSQPPTVTTVSTDGGLFQFAHTTTTTTGGSGGGIFGSTMAAPTTATPVFGQPAAGQNSSVGSTGLFGFGTPTTIPQNVTVSTTASLPSTGGLFASLSSQQSTGCGLFGSHATAASSKEVNSLFSNANFGLGANSQPPQNVFGRPAGSSAFGGQGLFGTPATTKTDMFGTSVFGAAVKNVATTVSGGLFSSSMSSKFGGGTASAAGGGLFGSPHSQSTSGFGSGPVFGGSAFSSSGGQAFGMAGVAAFGASSGGLFGGIASSPPAGGSSLFGVASPSTPAGSGGGGGLFAALAAKTESPTFGSLAHNSPQMPVTPPSPFGSSPSFTQRRA
ncbi:unnamed protein product [Calicophoron daubneyi]|uniref:Nuclear pore complex protein Nup214 n=1 Tax=Calicophoron daubneyi TaxID=300641 RepID=A0AAV2TTN9_CALDB